tara:strand:+ start:546 stop:665 length:120 start_codon:yes stop_codon:yes gene_type:complete
MPATVPAIAHANGLQIDIMGKHVMGKLAEQDRLQLADEQ